MLAFLLTTALVGTNPSVPVSVSLNQNGRYLPGSGVQVTVQPGADGYLLVLNADPDGRVRVLFPLDPTDDAFVRGGRTYQLEDRGGRNTAFVVDWSSGSGTIFAALSNDPLQPGNFALNGHWDYRTLTLASDDDEVALRTLAEQIAPSGVQYDFSKYFIGASDVGFDGGQAGFDGGQTVVAVGLGVGWGMGWGWGWGGGWWGPGWGWGWGWGPAWGWGWGWGPAWGWGPGWGWGWGGGWGGGCCWGGGGWGNTGGAITPYRSRELTRTWNGQPHPGSSQPGGVGVQGNLSGANSPSDGYRNRSADVPGVRGTLANPTSTRRQPGGMTPTSSAAPVGGSSRRVASDQLATAGNANRATPATGNRGASSPQASTGRRQTNAQGYRAPLRGAGASTASGDMARRSGGGAAGNYSGRAGSTGGSRAYGGTRGGSSTAGRNSGGYGSRGPSASGGSRGYGGSRGASGGGMSRGGGGGGGGSRGFSGGGGGFSGGGGRGGGGGGGRR